MKVIYCKKCLMPSSRPRIVFEGDVCNACRFAEERKTWNYQERRQEFIDLVKSKKRHPHYDMIVPLSGGKDSATIAYKLKHEYGFNPLGVTYGQLLWTEPGMWNWHQTREHVDIEYHGVSQRVSRSLCKRFFIERGHPKQHYDAAVNAVPVRAAVDRGIPLIVFAEHGESEYGGLVLSDDHRRRRDLAEVLENQIGDDPRNWATDGLTDDDLYPYVYPNDIGDTEAVYFSWYHDWDIYENAKFAREKMGFRQARNAHDSMGRPVRSANAKIWCWGDAPSSRRLEGTTVRMRRVWYKDPAWEYLEQSNMIDSRGLAKQWSCPHWWGKSDGSFEGFDSLDDKIDDLDFFMMHIKFGFGRATRMASRLIQRGHMTREQGLELVKQYDGEFPKTYLNDVLEYMHMTRDEFDEVVEAHRNEEIWKKGSSGWELRHPPK